MIPVIMIRFNLVTILWYCFLLSLIACAVRPKNGYDATLIPMAPDYGLEEIWAALPQKKDMADSLPSPELQDIQDQAAVDVFFLHPTT